MSTLRSDDGASLADGRKHDERGTQLWLLALLVVALLPSFSILSALALVVVTNNLDPAFALGVSDNILNGLIIAASGVLTGLFAGGVAKGRGWKLVLPPVAALVIGLAIYSAFVVFGMGEEVDNDFGALATLWLGQATGIVLATRFAGYILAAAVGGLVVLGLGAATVVQALPEAPAEVLLILEDYTYDDPPSEECWGSGELSGVVEGSRILLLEEPETSGFPTEVGSVVLPAGTERESGCVFELGNPLGGTPDEYGNIDFHPESDPGVGYSVSIEDQRVVIRMGVDG